MTRILLRAAAALLVALPEGGCSGQEPDPTVQAISFLGDTLRRPELAPATRAEYTERLHEAQLRWSEQPAEPEALIWVGRRTAYLGDYRAAITAFSTGVARFPEDARFLRHRGHRYITVRQLESAVADLERAAHLVAGHPDEVEPDGLPNPRNIPTSTLQTNIWYHLGLAYYLQNRLDDARRAFTECLRLSRNPDMLVATSHWLYMTLRRLGREQEAARLLEPITPGLDVIENRAYHRLLLMYKGDLAPDSLLVGSAAESLDDATTGYGVGNWYLYNGDAEAAKAVFGRVLDGGNWAAFGYIAAEAALAR